jgi:hypothetical protein
LNASQKTEAKQEALKLLLRSSDIFCFSKRSSSDELQNFPVENIFLAMILKISYRFLAIYLYGTGKSN